jgi:hypothetical protein
MAMFTSTDPLMGTNLPRADVSYVNFSNVALIETIGTQLLLIFATEFYVYIDFDTAEDAQAYAATLVANIG